MVNRLNRQVEYGLMALKVMAQKGPGQLTSAKEVCEITGSPFDPTARVLQQLKQKGFLQVEQGAQGGYILNKDLGKVSFYDLSEAVLGPMSVARCLQHDEACDLKSNCNILSPVQALNKKIEDFYRSLTLAEVLDLRAAP